MRTAMVKNAYKYVSIVLAISGVFACNSNSSVIPTTDDPNSPSHHDDPTDQLSGCRIKSFTADADQVSYAGKTNLNWETIGCNFTTIDHGIGGVTPVDAGSTETSPLTTLTAFKLTASDLSLLHSFEDSPGGSSPVGELVVSGSKMYGMTLNGGDDGVGIIFSVDIDGSNMTRLYNFTGTADGGNPVGSLLLLENKLYGQTGGGGDDGAGVIFSIDIDGSNMTRLHSFTSGTDGGNPQGTLTLSGNTLYGVTLQGPSGCGTVFSIDTDGNNMTTLYAKSVS